MSCCLIVDRSMTMRRIIRKGVLAAGYATCLEASTGLQALHRLRTDPVSLIVTGWNMPELSGLDLVCAVRHNPQTSHIPVLMVTANAVRNDVLNALEVGVDQYLVKPFSHDRLLEKLIAIRNRPRHAGSTGLLTNGVARPFECSYV
ncbi:MAG: response regulator [Vicinamibacterales bacterium]